MNTLIVLTYYILIDRIIIQYGFYLFINKNYNFLSQREYKFTSALNIYV